MQMRPRAVMQIYRCANSRHQKNHQITDNKKKKRKNQLKAQQMAKLFFAISEMTEAIWTDQKKNQTEKQLTNYLLNQEKELENNRRKIRWIIGWIIIQWMNRWNWWNWRNGPPPSGGIQFPTGPTMKSNVPLSSQISSAIMKSKF